MSKARWWWRARKTKSFGFSQPLSPLTESRFANFYVNPPCLQPVGKVFQHAALDLRHDLTKETIGTRAFPRAAVTDHTKPEMWRLGPARGRSHPPRMADKDRRQCKKRHRHIIDGACGRLGGIGNPSCPAPPKKPERELWRREQSRRAENISCGSRWRDALWQERGILGDRSQSGLLARAGISLSETRIAASGLRRANSAASAQRSI
jgi:hypothetical protein